MTLSRYEIAVLCKKATRGAGFAWGMAEEAGYATLALCDSGFDGPKILADYLSSVDEISPKERLVKQWPAQEQQICPIHLGVALNDFYGTPDSLHQPMTFSNLHAPLLLAPFLMRLCDDTCPVWSIETAHAKIAVNKRGIYCDSADILKVVSTSCNLTPDFNAAFIKNPNKIREFSENLILLSFADRTYVPDSEESRQRGAG